jgi:hypothetical protein
LFFLTAAQATTMVLQFGFLIAAGAPGALRLGGE